MHIMQTNKSTQVSGIKFNISEILTSFFHLKDWKKRSFYIGFPVAVTSLLFFISLGSIIFIAIRDEHRTETSPLAIPLMFLVIFSIPFIFLTSLSATGYQIKESEAISNRVEIRDLYSIRNFFSRLKHALIINILFFIYQIIPIAVVFIGYVIIGLSSIFEKSTPLIVIVFMVLGYGLTFVGSFLQGMIRLFINPMITSRYINQTDITDVINYAQTWRVLCRYPMYSFLVGIINYLLQFVVSTVIYIPLIFFVLAGIILPSLFPLLFVLILLIATPLISIGVVYHLHVQAIMIGNLARGIRENP